jgi:glutaredoxin
MMIATVWTQPNCIWCDRVKIALIDAGYAVEERDIMQSSDFLREQFKAQYGTTPQVFVGHKHIGNHDVTVAALQKGPLK